MLDCYTAALTAFHKSEDPLLTGMPSGRLEYQEARRLRERAFDLLVRARRLYWDHVAEHKCRRTTWNNCV